MQTESRRWENSAPAFPLTLTTGQQERGVGRRGKKKSKAQHCLYHLFCITPDCKLKIILLIHSFIYLLL